MLLLFSRPVMSNSLWPHGLQHTRPPCPSPPPEVCPSSCSLHRRSRPASSSSDALFSFCPQSFPASGTFPMSIPFSSDDQNTGASASASVLPVNIQEDWLFWSPCCPRDFQECYPAPQFKSINSLALFLLYGPALTTVRDHWEDHTLDHMDLCLQSRVSASQHTVQVCHRFPAKKQSSSDFWFHGCGHYPQWFWRGNLSLLPPLPLKLAMQ